MSDRVLIIGASRGIGRHAVDIALSRGCRVRAMARGIDSIDRDHPHLETFAGDATDSEAVRRAVDGVDAVILAIGLPSGLARRRAPVSLFSRATAILIEAMEAIGPRRLVVVTGYGAGDSRQAMSRLEALGHRALLGGAYDDKDRQEAIVIESDLDWTLVRPTILTNGPASGRYQVLERADEWRNGLVSRADVAAFLVDCALGRQYLRAAPVLVY
jgi:putative NADH-flavin reductase